MRNPLYLKNKINRQIMWNGTDFTFVRYKKDSYHQITDEVEKEIKFRGVYHQGGGYGGMLNIEIFERDGARTISKMKPMILCLYSDETKDIEMDDFVTISGNTYKVVGKDNITNFDIAFEISLEKVNFEVNE